MKSCFRGTIAVLLLLIAAVILALSVTEPAFAQRARAGVPAVGGGAPAAPAGRVAPATPGRSSGGGFPGGAALGLGILTAIDRGNRTTPPPKITPPKKKVSTSSPAAKKKRKKKAAVKRKAPAAVSVARKKQKQVLPTRRVDEILVLVSDSRPDRISDDIARRYRLTKRDSLSVGLLSGVVHKYALTDGRNLFDVIAAISRDADVILAQPNHLYRPLGVKKKARPSGKQYALSKLGIAAAHELAKGKGVTVAVIDTAVDATHPALKDTVSESFDAVIDGKSAAHAHGTAIAGLIAGQGDVGGVAPGAQLLAVRAFYEHPKTRASETSSFILLRALDWAFERKAQIFNMSFAGPSDMLINTTLNVAHAHGVVHVAAAGNGGPKAPPAYPAAYKSVIAITALDHKDRLYKGANRGAYLTAAAPGVDILVPSLKQSYSYSTGTSLAAAHISGMVALIMERDPSISAKSIRQTIVATAHDLGPKGHDVQFGAGRADAYASLKTLAGAQ